MKPRDLKCFAEVAQVIGATQAEIELQKVIDTIEYSCIDPEEDLVKAFKWASTPQRDEFWDNIDDGNIPDSLLSLNMGDKQTIPEIPFGKLTREQQLYLFYKWLDGESIECFRIKSGWHVTKHPCWDPDTVYRVTPQGIKPSVDWSVLKPEFKWLAVDEDGKGWAYITKPVVYETSWYFDKGVAFCVNGLASFDKGTCNWDKSLIQRPK